MGGGTVFRGVVRLAGAAAVGAAAAAPTSGAVCHVHPPVSTSLKEQENLSALLSHSKKEVYDVNANEKEFESFVNVRFEQEENAMDVRFEQEESAVEKEEGSRGAALRQLVFSPPPTEEEVEEATKELHAALHLSLPAQGFLAEESLSDPMVELTSRVDDMDVTPTMASKRGMTISSPYSQSLNPLGTFATENSSVMQAFQLLQTNPRVQDVVKSLACDPAVWNAVLSNEKVVELTQEEGSEDGQEYFDYDDEGEMDELSSLVLASKFYGYLTTRTKVYYSYMRGKFFSILENVFGSMEKTLRSKEGTSTKDKTVASCMMLAVAVVIVVVVRRSLRRH